MTNKIYKTIKGTIREMGHDKYDSIGCNMFAGMVASYSAALLIATANDNSELAMGVMAGGVGMSVLNFFSEGIREAYKIYKSKETERNIEKEASGLVEMVQ